MRNTLRITGNMVNVRQAIHDERKWIFCDWVIFPFSSISHITEYGPTIGEDIEAADIHFINGKKKTCAFDGQKSELAQLISAWSDYVDTH